MNWIRISTEIARDADIRKMARDLNVKRAEVIGCVTALLTHLPAHAPDGDLSTVDDMDVEAWACWERKRGAFAAAYRAAFCTDAGVVRSWEKYNGSAMRELEGARLRAAERRRLKRLEEERQLAERIANSLANGSQNGTANGSLLRTYETDVTNETYKQEQLKGPNAEGEDNLSGPPPLKLEKSA